MQHSKLVVVASERNLTHYSEVFGPLASIFQIEMNFHNRGILKITKAWIRVRSPWLEWNGVCLPHKSWSDPLFYWFLFVTKFIDFSKNIQEKLIWSRWVREIKEVKTKKIKVNTQEFYV